MKAIGYRVPGPLVRAEALEDIDLPRPVATGHDLLVEVAAVSVNPVDTKVRRSATPPEGDWKVLGWDAVGRVAEVGPEAKGFAVGDEVFYAGSIGRPGANSEFHLVDARIVGHKPRSLSDAEAAALPLTAITAWEMLFDRLDIRRPVPGAANAVLIIGGAGGVGSIAIQLVRALTDVTVIATASRPETREWVRDLGAHHVIDHHGDLAAQVEALGIGAPGFVFSTNQSDRHVKGIQALIAPQGRFGLIDDPETLDVLGFKRKAASIHWELMFTRPVFGTPDIGEQGRLLDEVAKLIDAGRIRTTLTERLAPINAENLREAHALIETNTARGKIVLEGF
ncbi:zinc-binding alcohol dehydrogenase family protein [Amaricoccus solimangrovi]|uniref:Zinc-type alcohol dehydrogenase-like protein n=1 Tax=Amaricoccus solimangrovi TaxID=2589815 RepID=A0A501W5N8_9RHOB|nr:zinc-binding alcohol dehydrogenase family protein [Amaricoccus solimangrovi]TPE44588.1 zinc-binding alcohol dehydrogenase family protein [Amaricoccus solimangrovi]